MGLVFLFGFSCVWGFWGHVRVWVFLLYWLIDLVLFVWGVVFGNVFQI